MWKYIISFFCIVQVVNAQVQLEEPKRQVFVRLGFDASRLALDALSDYSHKGTEISVDAEIKYLFFPTLELGNNYVKHVTQSIDYSNSGNYFRLGFDYNILKYKQRFDRNLFFVGARYGFTAFSQQLKYAALDNDWGVAGFTFEPENHSAHWAEAVIGLRAEIISNFYLGYTFRVKQMLTHSEFNAVEPYWIPGYGLANKQRTLGMSYSVFYAIPIKKIKPDFKN